MFLSLLVGGGVPRLSGTLPDSQELCVDATPRSGASIGPPRAGAVLPHFHALT
jgi:hypothetical protein